MVERIIVAPVEACSAPRPGDGHGRRRGVSRGPGDRLDRAPDRRRGRREHPRRAGHGPAGALRRAGAAPSAGGWLRSSGDRPGHPPGPVPGVRGLQQGRAHQDRVVAGVEEAGGGRRRVDAARRHRAGRPRSRTAASRSRLRPIRRPPLPVADVLVVDRHDARPGWAQATTVGLGGDLHERCEALGDTRLDQPGQPRPGQDRRERHGRRPGAPRRRRPGDGRSRSPSPGRATTSPRPPPPAARRSPEPPARDHRYAGPRSP